MLYSAIDVGQREKSSTEEGKVDKGKHVPTQHRLSDMGSPIASLLPIGPYDS